MRLRKWVVVSKAWTPHNNWGGKWLLRPEKFFTEGGAFKHRNRLEKRHGNTVLFEIAKEIDGEYFLLGHAAYLIEPI